MQLEQTSQYQRGDRAEKSVSKFLQERGFFVTWLAHIRNIEGIDAPMLMGARCNLILPDLHVIDPKGKPPFYVEVKLKAGSTHSALMGTLVHGIGLRRWEQYKRFSLIAQVPVYLLILEELSGELLGLRVGTKDPDRVYEGDVMDKGGMVFWKRAGLKKIAQLERRQAQLDLAAP